MVVYKYLMFYKKEGIMGWILIVVSTVFGNIYATQGITSAVVVQNFTTYAACQEVADDIYKKVKDLGYDPQKYIRASCIPMR